MHIRFLVIRGVKDFLTILFRALTKNVPKFEIRTMDAKNNG